MRGTHAVAEGRLTERVNITSKDEFKQLGDAFNSMADKLVELTEDVRKKERQAMFGRMAAGLVHDLSHPVQNIGNSCKLIVRVFDDPEYRQTFTRTIDREIETLKRVLDDLRNVARPAPVERFPLDVNRTVADIVESMRGYADECGIALESKFSSAPVIIEGDLFALGRVYRNLITNAIQATQAGGRVTIATARAGDKVEVSVSDTGSGIPPERLGAIFDDFVTTKKRGLGLGLAITKRIVEQLDGAITVSSEMGKGTTFTMRFPVAQRPMGVVAAAG
jgi:two-component system, NtrC family, sensor histidine kinase HydH